MYVHKRSNFYLLGFNKENCISSPLLSPIDI
jgi:hypothetical protein